MSDFVIRKATLADLDAIKSLTDAHRSELGFVMRPALAKSISQGEVFVAENNADLVGFVEYHHRRDEQTTLYHIAVEPDHRKQGIGRLLITSLANDAQQHDKTFIQLKCPTELSANHFYAHIGLTQVSVETGRRRPLAVWWLSLTNNSPLVSTG